MFPNLYLAFCPGRHCLKLITSTFNLWFASCLFSDTKGGKQSPGKWCGKLYKILTIVIQATVFFTLINGIEMIKSHTENKRSPVRKKLNVVTVYF